MPGQNYEIARCHLNLFPYSIAFMVNFIHKITSTITNYKTILISKIEILLAS